MSVRILIFVLVALAASLRPTPLQAQATKPAYLSQFPTVDRVKAEIKGSDPVDTSARQMGALWRLQEIVKVLAGPRFASNEFTPDEQRLIRQYFGAWQRYQYRENSPPTEDQPKWGKLREFYEKDPVFLDDLFNRFLLAEFRTAYQRATVKQPLIAQKSDQPGAALSIASGFASQPGAGNPLAGRTLLLLKESFGNFLKRKGMFQGPGSAVKASPLAVWAYASKAGLPVSKQALYEAQPIFVSNAKMDVNGRAAFPSVPIGTYYLFGQTAHDNKQLVWDLKVDLKPGANTVTLDRHNTAPLDIDQTEGRTALGAAKQAGSQDAAARSARIPPVAKRPSGPATCTLSLRGAGYVYTYTETNRRTGVVVNSFTERGNFSNATFYLLDEDAENVLQSGGVQPGWLGSRVANMTIIDAGTQVGNVPGMNAIASLLGHGEAPGEITKLATADYETAMKAVRSHSAAQTTTDANARAVFPRVPAGTYYLYGRFYRVRKPVRGGGMVWNMKVVLKPGENSIMLRADNAAWK